MAGRRREGLLYKPNMPAAHEVILMKRPATAEAGFDSFLRQGLFHIANTHLHLGGVLHQLHQP